MGCVGACGLESNHFLRGVRGRHPLFFVLSGLLLVS